MKDVEDGKRTARFKCDICYIDENGNKKVFEGVCEGKIAYEPIFVVGDKSFAQLKPEEKNAISHRGKAIKQFVDYIKEKRG